MIVLGIETSCDETAAAVVEDGRRILSSVVASQVEVHHVYGGVVPELASRKHIENITPVVRAALDQAGIGWDGVDGIAATQGPGLAGCLLVGFSFAKAAAFSLGVPWIGTDHLAGHIHSVFLEDDAPDFPFVALLASGGHTSLYYVTGPASFELMGQTRDDAAGEAYDKVSKMLGLGYPGGAVIDRLAREGDPENVVFTRPYLDKDAFDFSFSGIKTAVLRHIQTHGDYRDNIPDIAAGFQEAVIDVLTSKAVGAAEHKRCDRITLVGGVAANQRLRERLRADAEKKGMAVYIPSLNLCGDNGAMIAAAGYHHLVAGRTSDLDADVYSRAPSKKG